MDGTQARGPILTVQHLSKGFPGVRALHDVSFAANAGEVHVVMGENGAGKSTLMKILAGIYTPDEGQISLEGQAVRIDTPQKAQALGINLINQELNIAGNLTVAENIFMGSEPRKLGLVDRGAMAQRSEEVLKLLAASFSPQMLAGELSIAEQQQVEIARALIHNSKILIMDEPTAALSERETERLFGLIKSLQEKGIAIVYISHRLAEVAIIADRVSVLRDGEYIGTLDKAHLDNAEIVRMMVGRSLQDFYDHEVSTERTEDYLVVRHMSDGKKVKDISFSASAGEILSLSGLVGSGRTELARLVFGADPKKTGTLRLDGEELRLASPMDAIRHGIAYVPEDRKLLGLFLEMTSHENIAMNVLGKNARAGVMSSRKNNDIVKRAVESLAIRLSSPKAKAMSLSGGNQQKLLLARWLQIQPKVLILDEPTRGVDVGAKSEIYKLIGEVAKQGVAVIFISSELPEVVGLAQRVLVMREGMIVAELKGRSEISQEIIMGYATGVTKAQRTVGVE
jgi:ribose transport system ATP-binding protein